jgi:hypothetical protein
MAAIALLGATGKRFPRSERGVGAKTTQRPSRCLGTSAAFRMRLRTKYDLALAEPDLDHCQKLSTMPTLIGVRPIGSRSRFIIGTLSLERFPSSGKL